MEQLNQLDSLSLREKKKYAGVPEDWKLEPVCCLSDVFEEEVYYAVSEKGTVAGMAALRKARAFTLYLLNKKGEEVLYFEKHAGFFANKWEIFGASEDPLGSIQKHGSSKNHFQARNASGEILYDIAGPSVAPEVFSIRRGDVMLGKISKRPTRIAEEGVSRNDHFGIVFPLDANISEKSILLGALFLIDLLF